VLMLARAKAGQVAGKEDRHSILNIVVILKT
jgi:hypothetical protein